MTTQHRAAERAATATTPRRIALGLQALAIGAGGTGARAHTLQEWFIARGRTVALKRILLTVLTVAGLAE